jgi:hypothetical protein
VTSKEETENPPKTGSARISLKRSPGRVKKNWSDSEHRELSLAKLDVTQEQLDKAPQMTKLLNDCVEGGLKEVLVALRSSGDGLVSAFLKEYDRASDMDHRVLPWEAYALAAKIDIAPLLGAIMLAIQNWSHLQVALVLTSSHSSITSRQVKFAKERDGYKDRRDVNLILKALPSPSKGGNTFIINPLSENQDKPAEQNENTQTIGITTNACDINMDELFPDLVQTQKLLKAG